MVILTALWQHLTTNPQAAGAPAPFARPPRLTLVPRGPTLDMKLCGDRWMAPTHGSWPAKA